jgi:predicted ATPase/DNA-binding CsgD family transcriptional regulator
MSVPTQLPVAPNAILGREADLQNIISLLTRQDVRLLTISGPGGVGKTRLAFEVLTNLEGCYEGGIFFVPLDQLSDHSLVASELAKACQTTPTGDQPIEADLLSNLRDSEALIFIDNFEHLLEAAPLLARLLENCPKIKLLVTSRAALRLRGEYEYPLEPLALPDRKHFSTSTQIRNSPAISLFLQRAEAVWPSLKLSDQSTIAVYEICALLDGLPLAIELAAARIRMFPPPKLLERLKNGFSSSLSRKSIKLLSVGARDLPNRQQTMENTLVWSYHLLTSLEQALFRRLGVFAGGFTLEAAAEVCFTAFGESPDLLEDQLTSLLEHSLVRRMHPARIANQDEPRFGLLHVIQRFALDCLIDAGERNKASDAHSQYYLELIEQIGSQVSNENSIIEPEVDNLRVAMGWNLQSGNTEISMRLFNAVYEYWFYVRESVQELHHWGEAIIAQSSGQVNLQRAKVLRNLASMMWVINSKKYKEDISLLLDEAHTIFEELEDVSGLCRVLANKGSVEIDLGNKEKGFSLLKQGLEIAWCNDLQHQQAVICYILANYLFGQGEHNQAYKYAKECQNLYQFIDDQVTIISNENLLSWIVRHLGMHTEALLHLREAIRLSISIGPPTYSIIDYLYNLAQTAIQFNKKKLAIELCVTAQKLMQEFPERISSNDVGQYHEVVKEVRVMVGENNWELGITLCPDRSSIELVDWMLEVITGFETHLKKQSETQTTRLHKRSRIKNTWGLTTREIEVLHLVASGLSDKDIAEKLVLSPRTVNSHLASIYSKLGVNSRVAATRFVFEKNLDKF